MTVGIVGPTSVDQLAVLGLVCGVKAGEVRQAYLSLALKWHPDKHPPEQREEASGKFKDIQAAYQTLQNEMPDLPLPDSPSRSKPQNCPPRAAEGRVQRRSGTEGCGFSQRRGSFGGWTCTPLGGPTPVLQRPCTSTVDSQANLPPRPAAGRPRCNKFFEFGTGMPFFEFSEPTSGDTPLGGVRRCTSTTACDSQPRTGDGDSPLGRMRKSSSNAACDNRPRTGDGDSPLAGTRKNSTKAACDNRPRRVDVDSPLGGKRSSSSTRSPTSSGSEERRESSKEQTQEGVPSRTPSETSPCSSPCSHKSYIPSMERIRMARGSACVGRLKGELEGEDDAEGRKRILLEFADWAKSRGESARLELRGSYERGETLAGSCTELASLRVRSTLKFLMEKGGLSEELVCHAPEEERGAFFQGVEVKALKRLDVNGAFEDSCSVKLKFNGVDDVIRKARIKKHPERFIVIEVGTGPDDDGVALARNRCHALSRKLAKRGVPLESICVRVRVGFPDTAVFLACARKSLQQAQGLRNFGWNGGLQAQGL